MCFWSLFDRRVLGLGLVLLACACGGPEEPSAASGANVGSNTSATEHPPIKPIDADADNPESLEQALERSPGHGPILMRMAELAMQAGNPEKAVEHLREAVAADSENLDARLELGRALYQAGDFEAAIAETDAILEINPRHVDALYNLGAIHANREKPDLAISYWTRAVEIAPSSRSGQSARRGLDILAGRPTELPDIPEHQGVTKANSGRPTRIDPAVRERLIDFATRPH